MKKKELVSICAISVLSLGLLTGCFQKTTKEKYERYAECATLGEYKGAEYVPESREVTDDEVQSEIDSFCEENNKTTKDKESVVKDGDIVNITYTEKLDGSVIASSADDGETDGYEMTVGSSQFGRDFDLAVSGMKPGETNKFQVSYLDDYEDTQVAGMTVDFEVTVNYISVTTTPEYTDKLVKKATKGEYKTTDDYTKHLREDLQKEKDDAADKSDRQEVIEFIEDKTTFNEYPQDEIDNYITNMINNVQTTASNYGIGFETYMTYFYGYSNEADFLEYLTETCEKVVKEKIVICSIAIKEGLIANDDDVKAYREKVMEENDLKAEDVDKYYSEDDLIFYATEENVLDFLMESAVQVEEKESDEDSSEETEDEESDAEEDEATDDADAE